MSPKSQPRATRKRQARKLPKPPTRDVCLFSEQEREEFLSRNDYTGLEYLKARRIREKRHRTREQQELLARHDAVEASIRSDPTAVLTRACQGIDRGVELLLKLIHSGRLLQGKADWKSDQAVDCLASRLGFLREQLIRLADNRAPHACSHLWFEAKEFAEAVVRLAVACPGEFRSCAESSLTMPSLRTRDPKFTCDAIAIAKAIHLAKKHPAPDICDNRSRMGALCHYLVARIVEAIQSARREKEAFERTAKHAKSAELIPASCGLRLRRHYEACWNLPDWRGKADDWWNGRVKDMLKEEFDRMRRKPMHNPGLWQELVRATDGGTEKEKWRVLEKNCRNKLKQIAGDWSPQA